MKKNFIYWAIIIVLVFVLAYFIFSSSIFDNVRNRASLSEIEATSVLDDVKTYVTNNINNYEDGTIIFTKNDLLVNSIISGLERYVLVRLIHLDLGNILLSISKVLYL